MDKVDKCYNEKSLFKMYTLIIQIFSDFNDIFKIFSSFLNK